MDKKEKVKKIISLQSDIDELEQDQRTIASIASFFDDKSKTRKFYFYSKEISLNDEVLYDIMNTYGLFEDFRDFFIGVNTKLQERKSIKEFDLEELV